MQMGTQVSVSVVSETMAAFELNLTDTTVVWYQYTNIEAQRPLLCKIVLHTC